MDECKLVSLITVSPFCSPSACAPSGEAALPASLGSAKFTRNRPLASSPPAPGSAPGPSGGAVGVAVSLGGTVVEASELGDLSSVAPAASATRSTWKRLWLGVGPGGLSPGSGDRKSFSVAALSVGAEGAEDGADMAQKNTDQRENV